MRKRHQGDQSCLWGPCGEIDSLAHCIQCEFYPVRFRKTGKGEASNWAEYLTQLSNFRATGHWRPAQPQPGHRGDQVQAGGGHPPGQNPHHLLPPRPPHIPRIQSHPLRTLGGEWTLLF